MFQRHISFSCFTSPVQDKTEYLLTTTLSFRYFGHHIIDRVEEIVQSQGG